MYFIAYSTATMFNIPQILNLDLFWDINAGSFFLALATNLQLGV